MRVCKTSCLSGPVLIQLIIILGIWYIWNHVFAPFFGRYQLVQGSLLRYTVPEMPGTNLPCYCHVVPNTGNSKSIPIQTFTRLLLYHTVLCDDHEFASLFASAVQTATCDYASGIQQSLHHQWFCFINPRSVAPLLIKTHGFRFCSSLNHSVMSASTTNYLPWDSDALSAFSLTLTNNHVAGELHLSYINTVWLWHAQSHSLYGELDGQHLSRADLWAPARYWWCTITLSLWTWRWNARLLMCAITYILCDQIEWIWTFVNGP